MGDDEILINMKGTKGIQRQGIGQRRQGLSVSGTVDSRGWVWLECKERAWRRKERGNKVCAGTADHRG